MRGISPIELTKHHRNNDGSLRIDTYCNASVDDTWRCTWLNPMLNCFDGIIMRDLQELLEWTNCNIFLFIDTKAISTISVLTRIATGMLNKIEYLTVTQKQQLHLNLIQSIKWLQTEYIVANLRNSPNDMPF